MKKRFIFTFIIIAFASISCNMPFVIGEQAVATVESIQVPTVPSTATLPPPVIGFTPTIAPSAPPLQPTITATPVINLSTVGIKSSDLPAGFQELDAVTMAQIGLTQDNLAQSFQNAFRQAKVANMSAFINPSTQSFEVIIGMVFYPLTLAEQASFDLELSDPSKAITTFGQGFGSKADPLSGADKFGNSSIGLTFTTSSGALILRGDMVIIRRENVVITLLVMYRDSTKPPVSALTLSPILDARVKLGLGK